MDKKQKVYWFVPVLVLVIIAVAYFNEWDWQSKKNADVTADDVIELAQIVNSQIDEGRDKGTFYISGITEEELNDINDYVCSVNGMVDKYVIATKNGNKQKITFHYIISDNYYVKEKYLNGSEIPSDRPLAYKLYNKTVEILEEIIKPGMTDYEKELAIHDYIVANCKYGQNDKTKEYAFRAYGCLMEGVAVCNGYAEAMSLLLTCAGVENGIMTGSAGEELHAWNVVKLDDQWYQVDATWNDPIPDNGEFVTHTYFNVTDAVMDDSHTWNKELYEPCHGTKYNYFDYNGYVYNYSDLEDVVTDASQQNITGAIEFVVLDYDESVYTYDFISNIPGIIKINHVVQPVDNRHVVTIYLN